MASHLRRIPPLAAVAIVSILVVPCARTAGEPLRGLEPADLYAIRTDVSGETSAASLTKELGDSLKPIQIGTGLLVYLDQSKRLAFLKQWQQAIKR